MCTHMYPLCTRIKEAVWSVRQGNTGSPCWATETCREEPPYQSAGRLRFQVEHSKLCSSLSRGTVAALVRSFTSLPRAPRERGVSITSARSDLNQKQVTLACSVT